MHKKKRIIQFGRNLRSVVVAHRCCCCTFVCLSLSRATTSTTAMPSVQCYFINALFSDAVLAFIKEASEYEREKEKKIIEVIRLEKAKLRQRKFNTNDEKGICRRTSYFHAVR